MFSWNFELHLCLKNYELLPFRFQAGFFLVQHAHLWQDHLDKLFELYASGKLKVCFTIYVCYFLLVLL
jgi:hypothetical protein